MCNDDCGELTISMTTFFMPKIVHISISLKIAFCMLSASQCTSNQRSKITELGWEILRQEAIPLRSAFGWQKIMTHFNSSSMQTRQPIEITLHQKCTKCSFHSKYESLIVYAWAIASILTATKPFVFQGNAHVVYNGYFYYYRRDEPKIVKYDLTFDKQAGKD